MNFEQQRRFPSAAPLLTLPLTISAIVASYFLRIAAADYSPCVTGLMMGCGPISSLTLLFTNHPYAWAVFLTTEAFVAGIWNYFFKVPRRINLIVVGSAILWWLLFVMSCPLLYDTFL